MLISSIIFIEQGMYVVTCAACISSYFTTCERFSHERFFNFSDPQSIMILF